MRPLKAPRPWLADVGRNAGVSLIELLVAVTIGAILIFGATQVYVDSRNTYEVNESAARLQEAARYAMSVIEPDIRMTNHWGLLKGSNLIDGQSPPPAGTPTACGATFVSNLMANVQGTNNAYSFACAASGGAVTSADTLTVRRASINEATGAATGRLRICSTRIRGELVADSSACTAPPGGRVSDLVVNGYFVSRSSTQNAGMPALRRHALVAGPSLQTNEEIIPGVEDMQVQFGIDPTGTSGAARRYVNPDQVGANDQVVSVRIWLLVRAENAEVGFTDGNVYEYADRSQANGTTNNLSAANAGGRAYRPADGFRRLLVSRTIQVRNALGT